MFPSPPPLPPSPTTAAAAAADPPKTPNTNNINVAPVRIKLVFKQQRSSGSSSPPLPHAAAAPPQTSADERRSGGGGGGADEEMLLAAEWLLLLKAGKRDLEEVVVGGGNDDTRQAAAAKKKNKKKRKALISDDVVATLYECGVCCRAFPTGQALGGHMKKKCHYYWNASRRASSNSHLFYDHPSTISPLPPPPPALRIPHGQPMLEVHKNSTQLAESSPSSHDEHHDSETMHRVVDLDLNWPIPPTPTPHVVELVNY